MSILKIAKSTLMLGLMLVAGAACCSKNVTKIPSIKYSKPVSADQAVVYVQQFIQVEDMPMPMMYTGTGFGILHKMDTTYVITAGHLCTGLSNHPLTGEEPPPHTASFVLKDRRGVDYNADLVALDEEMDLCLLKTKNRLKITKISKHEPEVGDNIHYSGYPTGLFLPGGGLNYFDGRFSGTGDNNNHLYGIPVTSGASGSPVYNDKGEVIGMISAVMVEFHHMAIGTGRENILAFINSVKE